MDVLYIYNDVEHEYRALCVAVGMWLLSAVSP